ncbi:unnamed protein product, partial [Urochloa humidicola]
RSPVPSESIPQSPSTPTPSSRPPLAQPPPTPPPQPQPPPHSGRGATRRQPCSSEPTAATSSTSAFIESAGLPRALAADPAAGEDYFRIFHFRIHDVVLDPRSSKKDVMVLC